MKRRKLSGSMTVEMSFLMPMILFLIMGCILGAAAYETAVVGSTKAREKDGVETGKLQALYRERIRKKCVLFPTGRANVTVGKEEIEVTVTAKKGKFKVAVRKCAAVTEPERKIREKKKLEELANGAKNNN